MKEFDQSLWEKIKMSDIKSFEALFQSFYSPLCLYAFRIIKNEEVVKEIVSDVFLKIWQKREQIEIKQNIKLYLFRCVRNASFDYLKINAGLIQNQKFEINDKIKDIVGLDADYIFDYLSIPDIENDINDAINQFPPKCKEIFCLNRFELLSYVEISAKLNISVNTVKTQMSRALSSLHTRLKKYI